MLDKAENTVMRTVFSLCGEEGRCLVTPDDILRALPKKSGMDGGKLEKVLRSLELDGYLEVLSTDRKGEKMFVLTLKESGVAFSREEFTRKRENVFKTAWSVGSAVLAFLIGVLLRRIFR